jgi:hypothetical protein
MQFPNLARGFDSPSNAATSPKKIKKTVNIRLCFASKSNIQTFSFHGISSHVDGTTGARLNRRRGGASIVARLDTANPLSQGPGFTVDSFRPAHLTKLGPQEWTNFFLSSADSLMNVSTGH